MIHTRRSLTGVCQRPWTPRPSHLSHWNAVRDTARGSYFQGVTENRWSHIAAGRTTEEEEKHPRLQPHPFGRPTKPALRPSGGAGGEAEAQGSRSRAGEGSGVGRLRSEEGTSAQPRPRVRCVSTTRQSKHSCVAPPPERVTPARAVPGGSGTSAWLVRVGAAGLARGRHGDRLGSPRVPIPRDWSGRGPGR